MTRGFGQTRYDDCKVHQINRLRVKSGLASPSLAPRGMGSFSSKTSLACKIVRAILKSIEKYGQTDHN